MPLARNIILFCLLISLATLLCFAADEDETTRPDPLSQTAAGITSLMHAITERLTSFKADISFYSNSFTNYTNTLHYHYMPTWLSRSDHINLTRALKNINYSIS